MQSDLFWKEQRKKLPQSRKNGWNVASRQIRGDANGRLAYKLIDSSSKAVLVQKRVCTKTGFKGVQGGPSPLGLEPVWDDKERS